MTDNPFQPPADDHPTPDRPFAPLREALTALPRRGPALFLKLVAVYLVAVVSLALCVVPAFVVLPLAGWVAGRVTLGTADGDPPVPWDRMTLRRLWPTGAALIAAAVMAGLVAAAPSIVMLALPPAAALPMSLIADVAVWPISALIFFTWLRWVDDDHEEIGAQRALTDGARVLVPHAPTWLAAYAVVFVAHLPFEVLQFGDSQRLITGLFSGTLGAPPSPSTPLTWVGSVVGLLTWLWCWLALARLYRVAYPAPPLTGATMSDAANFLPDLTPSRRAVLAGVVGAGFALAAGPAAASTVTTDTTGLDAGDVQIPTPTGPIPGYQARPAGKSNLPIVLVVQEIFGVHEHIRDVCRRLAKAGYLAIAPYLYHRQGEVQGLASIDDVLKIVRTVPDAQVLADLDATATFAATLGGDPARVAATGFCWGGRIVWLYAAHSATLKCGVAWYGRLVSEATPLQPASPLDRAAALKAPVLGLYGGKDTGIPLTDVERMRAALQAAGSKSTIHVYPDAQHGFHADYRPSYDASAATDGFNRLLAWFKAHGVS